VSGGINSRRSLTNTLHEVYRALAKTPIKRLAGVKASFDLHPAFNATAARLRAPPPLLEPPDRRYAYRSMAQSPGYLENVGLNFFNSVDCILTEARRFVYDPFSAMISVYLAKTQLSYAK